MPSRLGRGEGSGPAAVASSLSSPSSSGAVPESLKQAAAALSGDAAADLKPPEGDAGGALVGAFAQAVSAAESGVGDALATGTSDWYVGINNVPVGPVRMSQLHSKAVVGAVGPDSMVWREGFEDWQPLRTFPELLAVVEDAQASASSESLAATIGAGGAPAVGVGQASGDGGVATTVAAGAGAVDDVVAGVPRRASPKAAWLAVAVALVFGLTVGFVMFGGKRTVETVVKYVEVPADGKQGGSKEAPAGDSEHSSETETEGEEKTVAAKGARRATRGGAVAPAAAAEAKEAKASGGGLKGLKALGGVRSGPDAPVGKSEAATSGQPLDSAQVQRTVARYTGSVKRSCWQPALSARDKNAPSTARVSVSIQVAPGGNVRSVSGSGDPRGYRGLASCITSRVRAWRFPASSGETTVNVPFVFAAQ